MKKQQIKLGKKLQLTKETLLALESQRQIAGGAPFTLNAGCRTQAQTCGESCITIPPGRMNCVFC